MSAAGDVPAKEPRQQDAATSTKKFHGVFRSLAPGEVRVLHESRRLIPVLERNVGRLIANGWPTGAEVSHAMVHGGPSPATSDGRNTSVGTLAMQRFQRPVCYQDFPDALLPAALRRETLASRPHRLDGIYKSP